MTSIWAIRYVRSVKYLVSVSAGGVSMNLSDPGRGPRPLIYPGQREEGEGGHFLPHYTTFTATL